MIPRAICSVFLGIAIAACSTVDIGVDYDHEEDFSAFQTYDWLPVEPEPTGDPRVDTPMLHDRFRYGIDRVLKEKGFQTSRSDPDFWVTYHLGVESKLDVQTVNQPYGRHGWARSVPETHVTEYDEGTIIIDIADAREKELVWRGVGTGRMPNTQRKPDEMTQRIYEVVDDILADFPPGAAAE